MLNQEILIMYIFAPFIALMLFIFFKMFDHFGW